MSLIISSNTCRKFECFHITFLFFVERVDRLQYVAESDDALSGVRSSWLIVAKKSLLSLFIS